MEDFTQHEIDLMSLIRILIKKWYVILIATIVFFGIATAYAYAMLENEYTARTSMMILVSNEEQTNEQNFNFSSKLKQTYTELAKSDLVTYQVIDNLNLTYTPEALRNMMSISAVQDTIIIKLTIVTHNPKEAMDIANETVSVMKSVSTQFEGFDNIEILDYAKLPQNPSGPNRLLYVAIGIILGGIVGVGIVFIYEMMDKTVKSTFDVEKKLGLRLLAVIPDYLMEEEIEKL
jgi:capsular polysaccharide biosynthesis protein